ncbi:MAG: tRNA lysidine(34) synthetase TilS [Phycisphaerales bacterium]|nr:tRNA lysidine(34) synthetase TilS [Phycisphaerales bacterium]
MKAASRGNSGVKQARGVKADRVEIAIKRSDPFVRAVGAEWRLLTTPGERGRRGAGARTLVACSGGADSSALAIALALTSGTNDLVVLGHVVHDLRSEVECERDREAVEELGRRLGVRVMVERISVRDGAGRGGGGGNFEAKARRLRLRALQSMAEQVDAGFIATGHHARDVLESVIMAVARGTGLRGLSGIAQSTRLSGGVRLIRPMLGVTPEDARGVCVRAGWVWSEDATNEAADPRAGLRSKVRGLVVPRVLELMPGAELGAVRSALAARDAQRLVASIAKRGAARAKVGDEVPENDGSRVVWDRAVVRRMKPIVLAEMLRRAVERVSGGRGLRAVTRGAIEAACRVIRGGGTERKRLTIGPAEAVVDVRRVVIRLRETKKEDGRRA